MKKFTFKNIFTLIIIVLVSLALFVSVAFLMDDAKTRLYEDVRTNMEEIVTQNRDVVTNKLKVEINNLKNSSKLIEERLKHAPSQDHITEEVFRDITIQFCNENAAENYFIAHVHTGMAYFATGEGADIHARTYYKTAIEGIPNISERIQSRLTGLEIFVISVPLYLNGEIAGSVQKWFSSEEMYELCSISLFSDQGNMNIINTSGYVMISSQEDNLDLDRVNYFNLLYSEGNQELSRKLQQDVLTKSSGSMEVTMFGKPYFSAYTPIPEVHNWYLITSVSVDAVSSNANNVIKILYLVLIILVLLFTVIMLAFLYYSTKQKNRLQKIAFIDPITKGNTYNKFCYELPSVLQGKQSQSFGILVFDIDNFKYINSFYGFDYGDNVLHRLYHEIDLQLQAPEMLARVSNDQFIALLTDCTKERVLKLLDVVQRSEDEVGIYLSAGLYQMTDFEESPGLMLDKAATAAQSIKGSTQRKLAYYSKDWDDIVMNNEQMKRKIDHALANGEIVPFYQPKVNVNSQKLVGAEALARWRTADGKLISPAEFIPLCEKTGQIIELDMAIFVQVLAFLKSNIQNGMPCLPISVNFSRMHLLGEDFIHKIIEKVEDYNVPSGLIQIELTESLIFENQKTIVDFVEHLHEHGLMVCIDDFGSGYSSLNMLKDIPIDVLKIDKAFLDDTKNPERQQLILSQINVMATKLNIEVVVEGVETERNVNLMKRIGCEVAQGYFYARPMEEALFRNLYNSGSLNLENKKEKSL